MNTSKIGAVFLFATLALAGIGVSYAGFTDTLNIYGTVQTATVEFTIVEYSGTWVWKVWGEGYDGTEIYTYRGEVGTEPDEAAILAMPEFTGATNAELISYAYARDPTPEDPEGKDVILEFTNLFPCIDFVADFVFTVGTIPVKVTNIAYEVETGYEWIGQLINNGIYATMRDPEDNPVEIGSQIHRDEEITVELHIHIPQENDLQGVSGSGSATLSIQQWNDDCVEVFDPKEILIPTVPVTMVVSHWGVQSYFDTTITGTGYTGPEGNPYNVWDDTWVGWCADEYHYINPGQEYEVTLWSTYDPGNPWPDEDWPNVNYLLNHKDPTATKVQIQEAIWYFVDGGYGGSDPIVIGMIDDAEANGDDFYPEEGQWFAVICDAGPCVQHTFIEVDP